MSRFSPFREALRACCLTILIYTLNVLRVPPSHATSAFADLNMRVYGAKHESLWGTGLECRQLPKPKDLGF